MDFLHFFRYKKLLLSAIAPAIITLIFITSCLDDRITPDVPVVVTGEVTDIDSEGARFYGQILNTGDDMDIEIGFVWDEKADPNINSSRKTVSFTKSINNFSVTSEADHLEGKKYHLRSYIKSRDILTYGNTVTFVSLGSLPPKIFDFNPKAGLKGEIVTITGENFSYVPAHVKVKVGDTQVKVLTTTDSTITFQIPTSLYTSNNSPITVVVNGIEVTSDISFSFGGIFINDFSPKEASCSGVITIKGSGFEGGDNFTVRLVREQIHTIGTNILNLNDSIIQIAIPPGMSGGVPYMIEIYKDGYRTRSQDGFIFRWPQILGISPAQAMPQDTIHITGNFLDQVDAIVIGGVTAKILNVTDNDLSATIHNNTPLGLQKVEIQNTCYQRSEVEQGIQILTRWTFIDQLPITGREDPISVALGNKIYIGLGKSCDMDQTILTDFWEYTINTNQWERKADFPGRPRDEFTVTKHKGKIIIGPGYPFHEEEPSDFWQYDPVTDQWEMLTIFPEGNAYKGVLYSLGENIYYGVYSNDEYGSNSNIFHLYVPETNSWGGRSAFPYYLGYNSKQLYFTFNQQAYLIHLDFWSRSTQFYVMDYFEQEYFWQESPSIEQGIQEVFYDDNDVVFVTIPDPLHPQKKAALVNTSTWQTETLLPDFEEENRLHGYFGVIAEDRLYIGLGVGLGGCYNNMQYIDLNDYR